MKGDRTAGLKYCLVVLFVNVDPELLTGMLRKISTIVSLNRFSGVPEALLKRRTTVEFSGPLYASRPQSFEALQKEVFPMLRVLGPHIYNNISVVVKLIRLARANLNQVRFSRCYKDTSFLIDVAKILPFLYLQQPSQIVPLYK